MTSHSEKSNPYVGPRPFERQDALLFKGRQQESRDLLTLFLARRLVLLYAPSGAGKTSLLKAKLIPDLENKEGFEVLPVARVGDSVIPSNDFKGNRFVFNLLVSLGIGENPEVIAAEEKNLNHFLLNVGCDGSDYIYFHEAEEETEPEEILEDGLAVDEEAPVQPRALIIDQFEEMFTMHPELEADRIDFFKQIGEAMVNDPYLYVMFSMRGDYLYRIIPYVHLLPNSLRARFQLQRLQAAGALQAVCEPAAEAGRPFDPDVAEKLVECLRRVRVVEGGEGGERLLGDFVEAMQLQVVCQQLWQHLTERPGETISMADVEWVVEKRSSNKTAQADSLDLFVDNALADYYEEALQMVLNHLQQNEIHHIDEYALRHWFSSQLITEAGTRDLLARMDNGTKGLPETAVVYLDTTLHLIRNEMRGGNNFIELVHDSFVEPIRTANQEWQEELERRIPWLNTARRYARNPNTELLLDDYNSLQAARKRMAEEIEKGGLPPTTLQFLENYLAKGEESYQRQLSHDIPWLNSARQYAENQNPDLLFSGKTLQLAVEQAAKAKAKGNLPTYADDFLQASIETERKLEIKKLRQQEEARRREELTQQELAHERSLAGEQKKRAGIAIGFGTLAIVLAIAASFFGVSSRINAEEAAIQTTKTFIEQVNAENARATAVVDREIAVTKEAEAVIQADLAAAAKVEAQLQQHLADSLRLAGQAKDYLSNGQDPSALLLSIEASQALDRARDAAPDNASLTFALYEVQSIMLEALFYFDEGGNLNQISNDRYFRDAITTPYETLPAIFPGPQPGTVATLQDGSVVYWSLHEMMTEMLEIPGVTEPISQTTISQNGTRLALLRNKAIEVYPLINGVVQDRVASFNLEDGFKLDTLMFNSDGTQLAVAACPELITDESDRNSTQNNSDESNCELQVYQLPRATQSGAVIPMTCPLGLPTVTAVAFLEQGNYLLLSGSRGLEPAPTQLLYLLELGTETCRRQAVSVPPDHTIQTITVLPETAGQPGFIITAGLNLQWWRFDKQRTQLQPFGSLLRPVSPVKVKASLFMAEQQTYLTLDETNLTAAYNTSLSQWPDLGCSLANRNLTYTEWVNAFPLDELDNYHQTCAVYGYEAFGIHISLAQHHLRQAQNDLQQCNLTKAQMSFNSALGFAKGSRNEALIEKEFSLWAISELLHQQILEISDCQSIDTTLQTLVGRNIIAHDLLDIARAIVRGKEHMSEGKYVDALSMYETAINKITGLLPEEYWRTFDHNFVADYINICANQLVSNYQDVCSRLPGFAHSLQLTNISKLANTQEIQFWEFEAEEGDFVSFVMKVFGDNTINTLDPFINLFDSRGNFVAQEDDYRSGQYSKITAYRIPEAGSYYVQTIGYEGKTFGAYELMVSINNNLMQIEPGTSQTASTEEVQLWAFAGQAGDFFNISMTAVGGSFEPHLLLLDSQGIQLNSVRGDLNSTATLSSIPIYESGTYYLLATGRDNATGSYELLLTRSVPRVIATGAVQVADVADTQMWQLSGDAEQIVSIEMTAVDTTFTPYFELLDSAGAYLTSSQLSADGRTATLDSFFMPDTPEQTFLIRTQGYYGETSGTYQIGVLQLEPEQLAIGDEVEGQDLALTHIWQFGGETGQIVSVHMTAATDSLTPSLTLLDEDGNYLTEGRLDEDGRTATLAAFFIPTSGDYYLRTSNQVGQATGLYNLIITELDSQTINPIVLETTQSGTLESDSLWLLQPQADAKDVQPVRIHMTSTDQSPFLPYLTLLDEAGSEISAIIQTDDGFATSEATYLIAPNETYFVHTAGYSGEVVGQYTIRAEVIDISSVEIEINGGMVIGNTEEQPIWSFAGEEGDSIIIAMNETDGLLDPVLVLYDTSGTEIAFNDDSNDTYNSLIEITLPESGQYFINTRGYSGASGTYELTVRRTES